jgi:hypothetical protein
MMLWRAALFLGTVVWATHGQASCNWRAGHVLSISGSTDQGGLRGTFTRILEPASGSFAEIVDLGVIKTATGFDGRLAWSRDVSGASHYLNSDFARRLAVSEAWLTSHLDCPAPKDARHFTPQVGAPIELRYDPRTGRIKSATLQYSENRLIHHYADWRQVTDDHFYPFVQRDEDPEDESDTVYKVRTVDRTRAVGFNPPPPPHDSRIAGGASTIIPYEDDNRRRIFLPVYLNGKGPFTFELDNGGHFILTKETAKDLGLSAQGSFASTGAGNAIHQSGYVLINRLKVGAAELVNQPAKVLALSHNERGGKPPRAGVLGLEFFERFIVGVDHRRKTLTLRRMSRASPVYPGRALPLLFDEDAPLVGGSYERVHGNVMLDIGNSDATIIEDDWAARHGLRAKLAAGEPRGWAKFSTGTIAIGPFTLSDETVAYVGPAERGSEFTRSVAAIAGEPLLSRFNAVYDYGHQKVWLDALPDVPPVSFQKQP